MDTVNEMRGKENPESPPAAPQRHLQFTRFTRSVMKRWGPESGDAQLFNSS